MGILWAFWFFDVATSGSTHHVIREAGALESIRVIEMLQMGHDNNGPFGPCCKRQIRATLRTFRALGWSPFLSSVG
jgi:hypothetical protein